MCLLLSEKPLIGGTGSCSEVCCTWGVMYSGSEVFIGLCIWHHDRSTVSAFPGSFCGALCNPGDWLLTQVEERISEEQCKCLASLLKVSFYFRARLLCVALCNWPQLESIITTLVVTPHSRWRSAVRRRWLGKLTCTEDTWPSATPRSSNSVSSNAWWKWPAAWPSVSGGGCPMWCPTCTHPFCR